MDTIVLVTFWIILGGYLIIDEFQFRHASVGRWLVAEVTALFREKITPRVDRDG